MGAGQTLAVHLPMGIYVYPTDVNWFRFLQNRSPIDEVNFWQPGGTTEFSRLDAGDFFLFRLKSPINMIAGGGVFAHASLYPLNAAWDAFGEKNGVASFADFARAIGSYRSKRGGDALHDDSPIGCIILQSPFFLPQHRWIPVPDDYHLNLVQGKRFTLESDTGKQLQSWASDQLQRDYVDSRVAERIPGPIYGDPALVRRRLGQGAFRVLVADAYSRRCAITGEKTLPVLQAAHIKPVSQGGEHRIDNGLLLRSDLHTLYDLGYVTVTDAWQVRVSPKLREVWQNGRIYYDLDKSAIRLPTDDAFRPSRDFLQWHADTVFRP